VLRIYDVSGRVIKNLELPTPYSLLPTLVTWDGTDEKGRSVASGIYFVSCETDNHKMVKKAILIR
jgi:flagellar hook assembly protein FlgD